MSPIRSILYGFLLSFCFSKSFAQDLSLSSPDKNLTIKLSLDQGKLYYHVLLDTNSEPKIKISTVRYQANELICKFENPNKNQLEVVFRVSNNDIAFRYQVPQTGEPANLTIEEELTGYNFPEATTTFLTPQASPMIGWMKTKPSYEEEYTTDQAMGVKPVVETTIPFDVVEPQYTASKDYSFGRSTWSWLLWQDDSIDFDDQKNLSGKEVTLYSDKHDKQPQVNKVSLQKNKQITLKLLSGGGIVITGKQITGI